MFRTVPACMAVLGIIAFFSFPAQAQLNIPMYKTVQQEIDAAKAQAARAIRDCDEESYEEAIDWLDEIAEDAPSAAEARKVDDLIDGLDTTWNLTYPCGESPRDNPYAFSLKSNFGVYRLNDAPVFLGKENGGVINTLSLVQPDRSGRVFGFDAGLRMPLGRALYNLYNLPNNTRNRPRTLTNLWDLDFGYSFARANLDESFTNIRTGGDVLLIPGVGSGPNGAGFSLAFAGGLNTVTTARYDSDYTWNRLSIGSGKNVKRNGVNLRTFGGIEYSHLDSSQTFSGEIPGFARDFRYDTDVDTRTFSPYAGIEIGFAPEWLKNSKIPKAELFGGVKYNLGYSWADGTDSLAFTGFNTQSIDIDEKGLTHGLGINAGMKFAIDSGVSAAFDATFETQGNNPVVTRDGVGPSNLSFERSYTGQARFGIRMTF